MISSGRGVRCPSDGRKPDRVAILLCVGSRDRQIGREWCSKICCTVSANLAMEIREELPDSNVYIYYMDIRTFGLIDRQNTYTTLCETSRPGVFVAGSATGPETIDDSIAQGSAAAMAAVGFAANAVETAAE
jgi:heterodisulfide reductase subunit A-like polyferredoxin